jgi:site-specific DNA-methyltransferase (adenine-specific)
MGDALEWMTALPSDCIHACVTDPPFSLLEYSDINHQKLRSGRGGVWRIPPSFDGAKRQPLPRFTVISNEELKALYEFFGCIANELIRLLVPGGHVFIASNPLLSSVTFNAFQAAGFEKRGEIIRQVQTLRGGDRPKGAEHDFPEVSMMPRSCWEPWGVFRRPLQGTAAECLRKWGTGGLRRPSKDEPLKDLILCSPTRGREKQIAPHPSLKPQRFLRQIVRASLPLGIGIVYDPFSGSSSTLAAAEALGYRAVGTDHDEQYYDMARAAFAQLASLLI